MALSFNGKEVNKICFNNNVGYIVAGNPTINDGVASEFSADNYVRTVKIFPTSNISTLEWGCKFTTGSNVNYQGITGTGSYWGCYGFRLGDYGALVITLSFSPNIIISFPASTIKSNSTYISKAYWNATTKEFSAKVSGDNGKTWTTSSMVVSDDFSYRNVPVQFGKTQAGNFRGSIDFNNTYIKVNGITWFSGKEQVSKDVNYVIKDGKLVWANPNLWLQTDGASYIDTGIIGNGETTTFEFAYLSPTDNQALFGARRTVAARNLSLVCINGDGRFDYQNTNQFSDILFPVNTKNIIKSKIESGNYTIERYDTNGVLQDTKSVALQSFTTPYNLALFARNNNGTVDGYSTAAKIYYFKIYTNGVLTKHFVPIPKGLVIGNYTVPSNGMWDIVSQTFFANQGTGNFIFGKEGTTPI